MDQIVWSPKIVGTKCRFHSGEKLNESRLTSPASIRLATIFDFITMTASVTPKACQGFERSFRRYKDQVNTDQEVFALV